MRAVLAAYALLFSIVSASADSCKATASDKKLVGAALKSFMTKCEADAKATCDVAAGDQKLAGAAKTSFTKKCVSDLVGR